MVIASSKGFFLLLKGHEQPETVDKEEETTTQIQSNSHSITSIADELSKLAKLRDQGVITEAEFVQMKGNLIKRT